MVKYNRFFESNEVESAYQRHGRSFPSDAPKYRIRVASVPGTIHPVTSGLERPNKGLLRYHRRPIIKSVRPFIFVFDTQAGFHYNKNYSMVLTISRESCKLPSRISRMSTFIDQSNQSSLTARLFELIKSLSGNEQRSLPLINYQKCIKISSEILRTCPRELVCSLREPTKNRRK